MTTTTTNVHLDDNTRFKAARHTGGFVSVEVRDPERLAPVVLFVHNRDQALRLWAVAIQAVAFYDDDSELTDVLVPEARETIEAVER